MPLATIDYKKPETLKVLKGLAKYLGFTVVDDKKKSKSNDSIITQGDPSIVPEDLSDIFSSRGIDGKKLREKAWQRTK